MFPAGKRTGLSHDIVGCQCAPAPQLFSRRTTSSAMRYWFSTTRTLDPLTCIRICKTRGPHVVNLHGLRRACLAGKIYDEMPEELAALRQSAHVVAAADSCTRPVLRTPVCLRLWAHFLGGLAFFCSLFVGLEPNGGWFMYPPLKSEAHSPGINADLRLLGIGSIEISAIAGAIELIVGVTKTCAGHSSSSTCTTS
jgi:hypothetical protein